MSERGQRRAHVGRDDRVDEHVRTGVPDARGLAGFLHVHAEVDQVDEHLRVSLRLHVAAHDAERQPRLAVLHHHRRHERVKRTLVRRDLIGVSGPEVEEAAAVLQQDAGVAGHDARAEVVEERLNQRHDVALAVGDGQVDGVAKVAAGQVLVDPRRLRRGAGEPHRLVIRRRTRGIDLLAPQRGVLFGDERLDDARRNGAGIGQIRRPIGERDPLRLDHQVQIRRRIVSERFEVEPLQDVQHLERAEALRIWSELVHGVAAIVGRDRIEPFRGVVGEVARVEQAVALLHVGRNGRGDRALVERVASAACDLFERRREMRVGEDLAGLGRVAVGKERRRRDRIGAQLPLAVMPLAADDLGHGVPVSRVLDRRRDRARERDRAVRRQQRRPAVDDAGHAHRQHAGPWNRRQIARREDVGRGGICRSPARVQHVQLPAFRVVHDGEQIAADAVHRRLDDGEHGGRRNRGVDGVAAVLQHLEAGGGGERLARGDHAAAAHDDRPRGARVGGRSIARNLRV